MNTALVAVLFGRSLLRPTIPYTGGNLTRLGQGVGYYNLNSAKGLALRALLRAHSAFTMLCVGDSTTAGVSSASGAVRADSWVTKLAAYLTSAGWTNSTDSFCGDANTGSGPSYQTFLPQVITFGSGWAFNAVETLGGLAFQNTTTTTGDLAFQRASTSDAMDLVTLGTAGVTKVRYGNIDQVNITPASTPQKTRVTWINAGTVMALRRVSGTVIISCAVFRDTTLPRIDIVNAGRSGSGTVYWTDNASSSRARTVIPLLAPEVVFIDLLIADWGTASGLSTATTKANLDILINLVLAYGGIPVLVVPHPTPTSVATAQRQADWTDIKYDLADQYGLPLLDMHAHFGNDYNNAVAAGYTFDTSSHYNADGYQDEANFLGAGLVLLAA